MIKGKDLIEELPETAFKFIYKQAIDPNYAEKLVEALP